MTMVSSLGAVLVLKTGLDGGYCAVQLRARWRSGRVDFVAVDALSYPNGTFTDPWPLAKLLMSFGAVDRIVVLLPPVVASPAPMFPVPVAVS